MSRKNCVNWKTSKNPIMLDDELLSVLVDYVYDKMNECDSGIPITESSKEMLRGLILQELENGHQLLKFLKDNFIGDILLNDMKAPLIKEKDYYHKKAKLYQVMLIILKLRGTPIPRNYINEDTLNPTP